LVRLGGIRVASKRRPALLSTAAAADLPKTRSLFRTLGIRYVQPRIDTSCVSAKGHGAGLQADPLRRGLEDWDRAKRPCSQPACEAHPTVGFSFSLGDCGASPQFGCRAPLPAARHASLKVSSQSHEGSHVALCLVSHLSASSRPGCAEIGDTTICSFSANSIL